MLNHILFFLALYAVLGAIAIPFLGIRWKRLQDRHDDD